MSLLSQGQSHPTVDFWTSMQYITNYHSVTRESAELSEETKLLLPSQEEEEPTENCTWSLTGADLLQ